MMSTAPAAVLHRVRSLVSPLRRANRDRSGETAESAGEWFEEIIVVAELHNPTPPWRTVRCCCAASRKIRCPCASCVQGEALGLRALGVLIRTRFAFEKFARGKARAYSQILHEQAAEKARFCVDFLQGMTFVMPTGPFIFILSARAGFSPRGICFSKLSPQPLKSCLTPNCRPCQFLRCVLNPSSLLRLLDDSH